MTTYSICMWMQIFYVFQIAFTIMQLFSDQEFINCKNKFVFHLKVNEKLCYTTKSASGSELLKIKKMHSSHETQVL